MQYWHKRHTRGNWSDEYQHVAREYSSLAEYSEYSEYSSLAIAKISGSFVFTLVDFLLLNLHTLSDSLIDRRCDCLLL